MKRALPLAVVLLALTSQRALAQTKDLYDETKLRTIALTFKQSNYWQLLTANKAAKKYIRADLRFDGILYRDVGVRFRGNSSYIGVKGKDKKPFKISFDEFVPGRDLWGHKTLNLNNNFLDPTMVREPLCYWVLRKFMPAPRCNYLHLTINGKNWGPYINVEQINKDFLDKWFRDENGNRYRAEWVSGTSEKNSGLTWLGKGLGPYQKAYEIKNENAPAPWNDLVALIDKLNNTGNAIEVELPKVLDVDLALRHIAAVNLLPLHDSYTHFVAHNYYAYHDPYHDRFAILAWDLNNSLGAYPFQSNSFSISLDPFYRSARADRPLVSKLLARPAWKRRYLAHFRRILNEAYSPAVLDKKIDAYVALIQKAYDNDPKKLYSSSIWRNSFVRDVKVEVWIAGLKPFIKKRSDFLRRHTDLAKSEPAISELRHWPQRPTTKDTIRVTARATGWKLQRMNLWSRMRGPWSATQMFDDGKHADGRAGDGIFGGSIAPTRKGGHVEYYVEATHKTKYGGNSGFLPPYAAHTPRSIRVVWPVGPTAVVLNEFVAKNKTGIRDEKGEYEDWIELVNFSNVLVPLSGLYLTDNLDIPTKWQIPAGAFLWPKSTFVVWADNDPTDGPFHATFKLDSGGEELALFDRDGQTLLDYVRFGVRRTDESTGRIEDRFAPWVTYSTPSPMQLNAPAACGTRKYSAFDPSGHSISLELSGKPKLGTQPTFQVSGAPPTSALLMMVAADPGSTPLGSLGVSVLFRSPILATGIATTNSNGNAALPLRIPNVSNLVGARACFEAIVILPRIVASNGLEVRVCR